MSFIFKRKQYDPFIPDDIENIIIEMDELDRIEPPQTDDYNEEYFETINEKSIKYLYKNVIHAMYVMIIMSLCIGFTFILILYKLI
jgi:hypothetical protein